MATSFEVSQQAGPETLESIDCNKKMTALPPQVQESTVCATKMHRDDTLGNPARLRMVRNCPQPLNNEIPI